VTAIAVPASSLANAQRQAVEGRLGRVVGDEVDAVEGRLGSLSVPSDRASEDWLTIRAEADFLSKGSICWITAKHAEEISCRRSPASVSIVSWDGFVAQRTRSSPQALFTSTSRPRNLSSTPLCSDSALDGWWHQGQHRDV